MNYTHKQLINALRTRAGKPMMVRELMRLLRLKADDRHDLKHALNELVLLGEIVKTRGNRYGLPDKMDLESGTFQAHPSGYGFVIPEKKGKPDIFIPLKGRLDAMDGDKVMARVSPPADRRKQKEGKREGLIIRVLERAHTKIVGTFELPESHLPTHGYVTPSNPRITQDVFIHRDNVNNAKPGDIVSAELVAYPLGGRPPEGRILRVIGRPGQPGIDSELIIEQYEIPVTFSPATLEEAKQVPQQVSPAMRRGRRDLRELPTVTIDGEKARDFDDAVSIERIKAGYRLWVHIADVAHYVKEGSFLDEEAYQRGTSVYLPDRAIPMLPEALSNGICSLNPNLDRLTLTCEMDISPAGAILRYDIYDSVINSNERMTYTSVREILVDRDPAQRRRYAALLDRFELMAELMEILKAKRAKRGSIDFDLPEPEIVLDLQGRMTDVIRAERNMAHQLIEEFMLAANETVAGHIESKEKPFIYRIHEEPAEEKLTDLIEFLATLGISLPAVKKLKPIHLQKALAKAKGTREETLINTVLLRTMKQARYSEENAGHFGLAAETYTHFTSPIRRYPDLIVHRILKADMRGRLEDGAYVEKLADRLPEMAAHSSKRERTAMEAERDVIAMLKLEFMKDKLGEVYEGIITGVTQFGFFVQLREYFVEGLVHVSTLDDDYYHYVEKQHSLRGERRKRVYRIGDIVKVNVDRVDPLRRKIDFSLAKE
ncbi:MAG: ribonuclease R [Nitrospirae bacterium GWC2_57_9]|nr:MAG: ribonuclease R [Nitrospirae bacterium GWC2_57_9]